MKGAERAIVITALVYMAAYVPYFLVQMYRIKQDAQPPLLAIVIPHLVGMTLNFIALVLTLRDLYLRSFPKPNDKLTWALLILLTGGIGWLVYVFKYALKPRPAS